jgi:hypothetical protein
VITNLAGMPKGRWVLVGVAGLLGGSAAVPAGADVLPMAAHAADVRGTPPAPRVRSVVARASAQGVRAVYTVPDYVVVSQLFDGGGPVTQAEADSTGRATSFAALPYPGENAVAAPGLLSSAFGRSVPLAYPFYVQADNPTAPKAELADPSGSYALAATAADGAARADGSLQGPGHVSGTRSRSAALLDDRSAVRTVAESVSTGISFGDGALRIASVTTRSETVLGPGDARPLTTTSLLIEGASVAGHAVTIDGDGVHAGDQAVPAPLRQGAGSDIQLLGQLGLSARVVPAGVTGGADALVITSSQTLPAPGHPKGTLTMTFGGAASEITVGSPDGPAVEAPAAPGSGPAAPPGPPGAVGGAPPPAVAAGGRSGDGAELIDAAVLLRGGPVPGQPVEGRPGPAAAVAAGTAPPPGAESSGGTEPAALAAGARPRRGAEGLATRPDLGTTGALYSLLGLGAIAMVAATRLLRWKGERG